VSEYRDLDEAIDMFVQSPTGIVDFGAKVAHQLRMFLQFAQIDFAPIKPKYYGMSGVDPLRQRKIVVDVSFRGDVPIISVILVHEGVHREREKGTIDEELECFGLQLDYYANLQTGFPYRFGGASHHAQLRPGKDPIGLADLQTARQNDQLIDRILTFGEALYAPLLTAAWVRDNITAWRGLRNRTPNTKGIYLRVLSSDESRNARTLNYGPILDIMESVTTRRDWDAMMAKAGPLDKLQAMLSTVRWSPGAGKRMRQLQTQWGVDLGAQ
jgi:hypothetical protein